MNVITTDSLGGETELPSSTPQTISNIDDEAKGSVRIYSGTGSNSKTVYLNKAATADLISDEDGTITITNAVWQIVNHTTGALVYTSPASLSVDLKDYWSDLQNGTNDLKVKVYTTDSSGGHSELVTGAILGTAVVAAGVTVTATATANYTPISFDLDHDGVEYLSTSAGVAYDYNGDGVAENTAWVGADDGLLAKVNEDGSLKIVFSTQEGETDLQGLAKTDDTNQDGTLDSHDAFFTQFGVWQDADSDGIVDSGEFQSLADREIKSLNLVSDGQTRTEAEGDVLVYGSTTYTKTDNTTGLAEDVGFVIGMNDSVNDIHQTFVVTSGSDLLAISNFDQSSQLDLSHVLPDHGMTGDNLKDYIHLVDNGVNTIVSIDADGASGPLGWVEVASLGNVHANQPGVDMFFDPTAQTIDFSKDTASPWKVEDGDTPAV